MMTLGEGRSVCRTIQTRCISGHGVPHQMRKPAPLVTPWTKTGQNLAEGGPFGLQAELERRVKRKSRLRCKIGPRTNGAESSGLIGWLLHPCRAKSGGGDLQNI